MRGHQLSNPSVPPFSRLVDDAGPAEHVEPSLILKPASAVRRRIMLKASIAIHDVFRQPFRSVLRAASGRRGILPASLDPDRVEIFIEEMLEACFGPRTACAGLIARPGRHRA